MSPRGSQKSKRQVQRVLSHSFRPEVAPSPSKIRSDVVAEDAAVVAHDAAHTPHPPFTHTG